MRIFTWSLLLALIIPAAASAQNGGNESGKQSSSGMMIRSGWVSPVYSKLKWVPDPRSVTTADVAPERREAGYWPDMQGGSSQQSGVVLLHFVEGTTIFSKGQENDRAFAILEHTFYNTSLVEQMEYVTITAAASPEGTTADNERLAANRALAIKEHIMTMFPYLDRDRIVTYSAGEDWNGLKRLIEEDLYVPGREAALRLLGSPLPGNMLRDRLQGIAGGETYRYISEHMFPSLRGGAACLIYFKEPTPAPAPAPEPVVLPVPIVRDPQVQPVYVQPQVQPVYVQPAPVVQPVYVPAPVPQPAPVAEAPAPVEEAPKLVAIVPDSRPEPKKAVRTAFNGWVENPILELKTNLIYDATATLNLGVEFRLGDKTSIDIPVNYNGWDVSKEKMWRHVLVQPEFRYWTGNVFKGHFFGAHAVWSKFNFGGLPFTEVMKVSRYDGSLFGVGVSYGYRWNFRNPRWGMEATLGVGYASLKYDEYACVACGTETPGEKGVAKQWLGPTKAGLSLIYRLGGK